VLGSMNITRTLLWFQKKLKLEQGENPTSDILKHKNTLQKCGVFFVLGGGKNSSPYPPKDGSTLWRKKGGGNLCIVSVSVPHGWIGNNISADIIECTLIFYYVIME
jgi:hypothetical protein